MHLRGAKSENISLKLKLVTCHEQSIAKETLLYLCDLFVLFVNKLFTFGFFFDFMKWIHYFKSIYAIPLSKLEASLSTINSL